MTHKFKGIRTLIYKVEDTEKAKQWYAQILGFPPYFDEPFYIGFNVGGYELGLQPVEEGEKAGPVTYLAVEDVASTFQYLLDNGASAYEMPADVGGGIVIASVTDPMGNTLGIIYNPHFQSRSSDES
ncbi:MAG: VOC family protein [Bacteroidia bacterium]|nr:VOC family protein [Bacteroidia bacterium]